MSKMLKFVDLKRETPEKIGGIMVLFLQRFRVWGSWIWIFLDKRSSGHLPVNRETWVEDGDGAFGCRDFVGKGDFVALSQRDFIFVYR